MKQRCQSLSVNLLSFCAELILLKDNLKKMIWQFNGKKYPCVYVTATIFDI